MTELLSTTTNSKLFTHNYSFKTTNSFPVSHIHLSHSTGEMAFGRIDLIYFPNRSDALFSEPVRGNMGWNFMFFREIQNIQDGIVDLSCFL